MPVDPEAGYWSKSSLMTLDRPLWCHHHLGLSPKWRRSHGSAFRPQEQEPVVLLGRLSLPVTPGTEVHGAALQGQNRVLEAPFAAH